MIEANFLRPQIICLILGNSLYTCIFYSFPLVNVGRAVLCALHTEFFFKIAKVHTTVWGFDNEGLVEINFGVKVDGKSLNAALLYFLRI